MKLPRFLSTVLLALTATAAAPAQDGPAPSEPRFESIGTSVVEWDEAVLDAVAKIPVQADGRIKPFSTFADFALLQMYGRRSLSWEVEEGGSTRKLSRTSVEWLLDCMFFPERAVTYPCFLLDTYEVADSIGVSRGTKSKRDRWSYVELAPGRGNLARKRDDIVTTKREQKLWTVVEAQTVTLADKMLKFESFLDFFEFARKPIDLPGDASVRALFGGADKVPFSTLIEKAPAVLQELSQLRDPKATIDTDRRAKELSAFDTLVATIRQRTALSDGLCLIPPPKLPGGTEAADTPWLFLTDVAGQLYASGNSTYQPQIQVLSLLDQAFEARENRFTVGQKLTQVHDGIVALAKERGEYKKIESEVAFYRADLFTNALVFYIIGFVLVALGWMTRADHWLHRVLPWFMVVPWSLHVSGVVWRCVLRGRPPVSTLYETILFISGVAVMVALLTEFLNRRRIAVAFAAVIGAVGLFFAWRFEAKDAFDSGTDTMPKLRAVLDTNFWLATHVTTVTIGYSAGLLAAFIAYVYVIGQLFGIRRGDTDFYKNVVRMVYGVLCFGLLFSVVGTILGGIWANESWGRFWGWDPKENGALMICLWELAVLHGRMGGYLRDLGLCAGAIVTGGIVAFSWWHVNLLGTGLHSYGFTHGIAGRLYMFYAFEALLLFAALYIWLDRRAEKRELQGSLKAKPQPGH
jgi:ABC-type transport system involved in cytochrome c biogenesis permease subunit